MGGGLPCSTSYGDTVGSRQGLQQHCPQASCPAQGHQWAEPPWTEPWPVQKQPPPPVCLRPPSVPPTHLTGPAVLRSPKEVLQSHTFVACPVHLDLRPGPEVQGLGGALSCCSQAPMGYSLQSRCVQDPSPAPTRPVAAALSPKHAGAATRFLLCLQQPVWACVPGRPLSSTSPCSACSPPA